MARCNSIVAGHQSVTFNAYIMPDLTNEKGMPFLIIYGTDLHYMHWIDDNGHIIPNKRSAEID